MVVLDAPTLGTWQSCRRRYLLDQRYRYMKWPPRRLWDACLRSAIISISQGQQDAAAAASVARSQFLQSAANPGLDITTNPYAAARDWCAMLDTTLLSLTREGLPPKLREHPPVSLNGLIEWHPVAQFDGQSLHRWLSVDYWTEQDRARELHSWRTIGDVALTRLPLILHVIEIGQVRGGRRASPWIRAWKHPTMPSLQMHFKGKTPGAFKGWKPFYIMDSKVEPAEWVEQMWQEGAAQELVHHLKVNVPSDEQCAQVVKDILSEALAMKRLQEERVRWNELAMSRNACDWGPCHFQPVCYGGVNPAGSGLYQLRPHGAESALVK